MKRMAALLIVLGLSAIVCSGCGDGSGDPKAAQMGMEINRNVSRLFPTVSDLKEIKGPVAIIVSEKSGNYKMYKGAKLATAADLESAGSVLLLEANRNDKKIFGWRVKLSTVDGGLAINLNSLDVEKISEAEDKLLTAYTFSEGAEDLPSIIRNYEKALFAEDYLTAINKSADSYAGRQEGLDIDPSEIREPLVYLTDTGSVVKPVDGDLAFSPAAPSQYVSKSASLSDYRRPAIEGEIGLGFTGLGRQVVEDGKKSMTAVFTVEEIKRRINTPSDVFCFSEVVGCNYYTSLTLKKDNTNLTLNRYVFRVSVIKKDGTLLGYFVCSSNQMENDGLGFNVQIAALTMSYDKYDRIVVPWEYLNDFWRKVPVGQSQAD